MSAMAPCQRIGPELLERARRSLARQDRQLAPLIRRVGPCALRKRGSPYRFLVRSVVYQQLAGSAARAIEGRLHAAFGGRVPEPAALAEAPASLLREVGLSRQKTAALHAVAAAFMDGTVRPRALSSMSDEEVVDVVTQIRGVGEWTAHMLLMFSLGRPDVLPVGDYGVRKGARLLYGLPELPARGELEALAKRWRPYRSVASWYLWRATETLTPGG